MKRILILLMAAALLLGLACAAAAETFIGVEPPEGWPARVRMRLTVFRTADSDCMLVQSGEETLLVDGGFARYGKPMYEKLRQLGIEKLRYVFITHPHDDHVQGLYDLFESGMAAENLFSVYPEDFSAPAYQSAIRAAERQGAAFAVLENGARFSVGETQAEVRFWPMDNVWVWDSNTVNAHSAVIRLDAGACSVLLTADIHNGTLQYFMENAEAAFLDADILKVPHHGRLPMEKDFVLAVSPEMMFCNNKKENTMPVFWQAKGLDIPLLYSGAGTIILETDGNSWYVRQENGF